ncbi:MAG: hypothetical protein IPJ89_03675 [Candidatus Iainarchaeum archaeon]|uniref:Uncharacterized protein n=1 Tax=Candidatus Iainarchaeum sp. TaxID=3101447 RepID=A0A7T9DJ27_9ARCH|nr:MAG: hypothetical protein IPJ89_03675 [Candidatus Diapherotrites archaeon]
MNVILKGHAKAVAENMVRFGYVNTQSEAIRMALTTFAKTQMTEEQLVQMKLDWIDEQVKLGKRRVLNSEQALGKYAKLLKHEAKIESK